MVLSLPQPFRQPLMHILDREKYDIFHTDLQILSQGNEADKSWQQWLMLWIYFLWNASLNKRKTKQQQQNFYFSTSHSERFIEVYITPWNNQALLLYETDLCSESDLHLYCAFHPTDSQSILQDLDIKCSHLWGETWQFFNSREQMRTLHCS